VVSVLLARSDSAMPMAWMRLLAVVATGVAYGVLVRR
jgi:hypothetical protein